MQDTSGTGRWEREAFGESAFDFSGYDVDGRVGLGAGRFVGETVEDGSLGRGEDGVNKGYCIWGEGVPFCIDYVAVDFVFTGNETLMGYLGF